MSELPLTTTRGGGGGGGSEDPYFVFRNDLLRKLELVDEHLAELERVVHEQDTIKLRNVKKVFKKSIKDASLTLNDLETCVQLSTNSNNNKNGTTTTSSGGGNMISSNELYERQCFIKACQDRLKQARHAVATTTSATTANGANGSGYDRLSDGIMTVSQSTLPPPSSSSSSGGASLHHSNRNNNNNSHYAANALPGGQQTSLLMQHQDETLDQLDVAVTRVGDMAMGINEEIGHQGKLLDQMEEDLNQAEEELGVVMGKLSDFLQTKDQWQLCTIVALFVTAMVLLFLVVYV